MIATTAGWSAREWRFGNAGDITAKIAPALSCNTNDAAIAAAVAGFGLTRVPSYQIADELRSGALVAVLERFVEAALPIHVVHAKRQRASAKIRPFVDFCVGRLRRAHALWDLDDPRDRSVAR